jgi:7,8-dihydroneopterin aldolase/epimerase/oxygenase
MATISLEGMQFQGFHGVYAAERILGATFIVDVHIDFDLKAVKNDDLTTALNYEAVHQIVDLLMTPPPPLTPQELAKLTPQELEMRKEREPKQLIETVAQNILVRLKKKFDNMHGAHVRIRKMHPPLPGRVESSTIEAKEAYLKECVKCKKNKFSCYNSDQCWCKSVNIHNATREMLSQQFTKPNQCPTLCPSCLEFYSNSSTY